MDRHQVPQEMVDKVGKEFATVIEEIRKYEMSSTKIYQHRGLEL